MTITLLWSLSLKQFNAFLIKAVNKRRKLCSKYIQKGMGVCGVYPQDIAETKMNQVMMHAKEAQHPLQCVVEPA